MPVAARAAVTRLRRLRRWVLALAAAPAAVALCLAGPAAGPALAHAHLVSSTPGDGSTVEAAPARIVLRFDEAVQASSAQVAVTAPDGSAVSTGAAEVLDAVVSADVDALPAAGDYTVGWRIVSADGHPVDGQIVFSAMASAADQAGTGSTPDDSAGDDPADGGAVSDGSWLERHAWHVAAGAGVIAIGLVLWAWERRGRRAHG